MHIYKGQVAEIQLDHAHTSAAWITCPTKAVPHPGRYLLAWAPDDMDAPLATSLFAGLVLDTGFLAVPPIPSTWEPGTDLVLRGPLGRGFDLPPFTRRLALAALGETIARLRPLLQTSLDQGASVALFTDLPIPSLPSDVEVHPLSTLPEALIWADFLALDMPLDAIPSLTKILGSEDNPHLAIPPAQALVVTGMPCGSLAECGACGLSVHRGWKLACKDGPVFDLNALI